MTHKDRLINLIKNRSLRYSEKPFRLSSGAYSHFYLDLKRTTQSPEGLHLVGRVVFEKAKEIGLSVSAIGGLTMGADSVAMAVAMHSYGSNNPLEAFVVRKEPKQHGLMSQIEGNVEEGDNVIIVEDIVTTGISVIKAIEAAVRHGLNIAAVIILVDRCEQNGRQNIEATGYPVYSILTINDLLPACSGRLSSESEQAGP
ncbi:orotate phosphoribosyltransferase [Thermodesulfovibrionales bacterium]|nr:orotate phosphoribosyltransferase [Thermodesulfovibrionales bacterium]